MKTLAFAVVALFAAAAARAQGFADAKKRAAGMESAQGHAVAQPLGRAAPGSKFSRTALKSAEEWLLQPEPKAKAVAYVNHEGCALVNGQLLPLNAQAWEIAVKETAAKTEVVYFTPQEMQKITGNRMAVAVGMNSDMRQFYESQMSGKFPAAPGKHVMGLRRPLKEDGTINMPGANESAEQNGTGALQLAHELMHIVLRQFGNENLGGGPKKASVEPDVANAHHEFICGLPGWCQFNQGWQSWDGSTSNDCAANAEAAQKHNGAFSDMMKPKH